MICLIYKRNDAVVPTLKYKIIPISSVVVKSFESIIKIQNNKENYEHGYYFY